MRTFFFLIVLAFAPFFAFSTENKTIPKPNSNETATNAYSILGKWVCLNENGYTLTWTVFANGTFIFRSINPYGILANYIEGAWELEDGVIYELDPDTGIVSFGALAFVNSNHMVVTVIQNGDPNAPGEVRHYFRQ